MFTWENIQNKVEDEYILNVLKKEVSDIKIKRIFSFNDICPKLINNSTFKYDSLDEDLYILLENEFAIIINFYYYSNLHIEYRKLNDEEIKRSISTIHNKPIDFLNSHHEIHGWDKENLKPTENPHTIIDMSCNYDSIIDFKVNGFNNEYESSKAILIPSGGDYFNSISFILKNGIEIKITPQDAFCDGYYDVDIIDTSKNINYKEQKC